MNSISQFSFSKEVGSVNNLNRKEFQENLLHSSTEIINEKQSTSSLELTPNIFRTVKEFTRYWLPIQGRIHDKCLNLMKALHNDDTMNSTHLIAPLYTQLNNEFIIISQLCTVMIGLSKQTSSDNGLTHKFIIYRQNMENLAELFIKLSKNINGQYQKFDKQSINAIHLNNDDNSIEENKTLLEQTIQQLLTEVNLFYTTILANSKILFHYSMNRSPESNRKCSSLTKEKTNMFHKLNTSIPSLSIPSFNSSLNISNNNKQKFLSKSYEFINTLSNSNQKIIPGNLSFQKLSKFCLNSLYIIDNYLNYLIQFQSDTISVNSPYFKKTNLSVQSIIEQTKMVMESSSQLIRYTMSICNQLKPLSSVYNINDHNHSDTLTYTSLLRKLEYMIDKLCESLKGLVTLTKEIAKFLTNEFEIIPSNKIIPIPGPLLQRLNGALKSVQNSIKTIHELTKNEFRKQ